MSNLIINGGNKLSGEVTPSGNKNSVLPILCATLLTNETVKLHKVPDTTDVNKLVDLLISIGSEIKWDKEKGDFEINNSKIDKSKFDNDFPVGMRGSILLFPPLLYRMKKLTFRNEIGGCALGIREIDTHLEVLKALGASVEEKDEVLHLSIVDRFPGGNDWQDFMSVTTTENFIMGAVLAKGKSKLVNAASEPHVQDLCNFLISMGAKISGIASCVVEVQGVEELHGTEFTISPDYHEVTTYLALGAMTGGEIKVHESGKEHLTLIVKSLKKLGVTIEFEGDTAIVREGQSLEILKPYTSNMLTKIEAAPWPYFPVDVMPLLIALSVKAKGEIMFWNKVYESGFFWIPEMIKFGAHMVMGDPHRIFVFGGKELTPATVVAPNIIRAAIALTMVGLSIKGKSTVKEADPIKRAHPHFIENLQKLGADISWE